MNNRNSKTTVHIISFFVMMVFLFSCEEILEETLIVEDVSNQNVTILAPTEGAQLEFTSINFNWIAVDDAISYNLQIATPDFQNAQQIIADVSLDSVTQYTTELTVNAYQWRIKALNSDFETPYTTASFEIIGQDDFSQNVVNLSSPEDNFISNQVTQVLQWNAIQGATGYTIEIEDTATQMIADTATIAETSYEYTFTEGNFIWRVRAKRDEEVTLFTEHNILIDVTAPNTPSLSSPADTAVITDTEVTFVWTLNAIAGSTEFDVISIYEDEALTVLVEEIQTEAPYATTLTSGNTYYWLVQSFDEAGNESEQSEVFSFTIN